MSARPGAISKWAAGGESRCNATRDDQWTDWLERLAITLQENGEDLLIGPVVDQTALHGLLKRMRDLGLPLLLMNQVEPGPDRSGTSNKEEIR
jgi:DNA polymerase elongation subunit (family B)